MSPVDMSFPSDMPSGLHLPQPSTGDSVNAGSSAQNDFAAPPIVGQSNAAPTPQAFSSINTAPPAAMHVPGGNQALHTDQTDELDKEWIDKAKLIVEQTKQDPYTQSKEIGRAKADYLRIRFNKQIKLGPDQTL